MSSAKWSESEKRIARRVFDTALHNELTQLMAEFKQRAATAKEPEDMWFVEQFLATARRDIDSEYDYRYSQLVLVFGRLLREVASRSVICTVYPKRSSPTFAAWRLFEQCGRRSNALRPSAI